MGFLNNQFNRQQAPIQQTGQQGQIQDIVGGGMARPQATGFDGNTTNLGPQQGQMQDMMARLPQQRGNGGDSRLAQMRPGGGGISYGGPAKMIMPRPPQGGLGSFPNPFGGRGGFNNPYGGSRGGFGQQPGFGGGFRQPPQFGGGMYGNPYGGGGFGMQRPPQFGGGYGMQPPMFGGGGM